VLDGRFMHAVARVGQIRVGNCKVIQNIAGFGKAIIGTTTRHGAAGTGRKQGTSLRKKVHGVNQYPAIYPLNPKKLPHKDARRFA
jgi:hypothetical protein